MSGTGFATATQQKITPPFSTSRGVTHEYRGQLHQQWTPDCRTLLHPRRSRGRARPVPPAALAIHLSIGQAYAFSVFNLPLSRLLGRTESAPGDWKLSTIGWVFSLAIVFLGLSAAAFGRWVERVGPRKAMFASAVCFSAGFFVSAVAVASHQF